MRATPQPGTAGRRGGREGERERGRGQERRTKKRMDLSFLSNHFEALCDFYLREVLYKYISLTYLLIKCYENNKGLI